MNYRITFSCPACGVIEYAEVDMSNGIGNTVCTACGCGIDVREKKIKPLISQIVIEVVPQDGEK